MNYPKSVILKEVGPRDGLQNESVFIDTEDKIKWINLLSETGLSYIELTSFVNPSWIPALKDAEEVVARIHRKPGIVYAALVPNTRGLERALRVNVEEVSIFMSATESHNQKNINKSITATLPILKEVADVAVSANKTVRGYLSTVFGCPYEGQTNLENVLKVTESLFEMGVNEVSLGDTIGKATPAEVRKVLASLLEYFPAEKLAMHFHDTNGMAVQNVLASLDMGISKFDGAISGLGGCPYAVGAPGNVATEKLVTLFEEHSIGTGVDMQKLTVAKEYIQKKLSEAVLVI